MHDAPYRAEQPDERRSGADTGQFGQTALPLALQVAYLLAQRIFHQILRFARMFEIGLAAGHFLQGGESGTRQTGKLAFMLFAHFLGALPVGRIPELLRKSLVQLAVTAALQQLVKHDRPSEH